MDKDEKKKLHVKQLLINTGKIVAVAGVAVVAGVIAIASKDDAKDEGTNCDNVYDPFARGKKQHYSDFELADFCRGGDLTED